jgi:hypothetical protein
MYVIKRGTSLWLCDTARSAFDLDAIQLRLQGEFRNFAVFEQLLNSWEPIDAVVVSVHKCSNASKCEECEKYITGCEILKAAQETLKAHNEFAAWVEANYGYMLY